MKQNIKVLLISIVFVALGIFAYQHNAPWYVSWSTIIFFGFGTVILIVAIIYERIKGKPLVLFAGKNNDSERVVLRDGRDYKVEAGDENIVLINKKTGEKKELLWPELTQVYIIAIDAFPVGDISYVLHRSNDITEIPTDAEGNDILLKMMQEKLAGFDNEALIAAMSMLHGYKKLWPKDEK
jgi:hypothetical protein